MRSLFMFGCLTAVAILLGSPGPALPKPQLPPPPSTNIMAVSPDGNTVAVAFGHPFGPGGPELISTKTGRGPGVLLNQSPKLEWNLQPTAIAFSPDSRRIAVGGVNGNIAIWDATKTGTELLTLDAVHDRKKGGRQDVRDLAYFPDGNSLVAITGEAYLKRWDTSNGKVLGSLSLSDGRYLQAAVLSRDGKWAASAHENAKIHNWNVEAGAIAKSFQLADGARVRCLAFAPDAKKIAVSFQIDKLNNGLGAGDKTIVLDVQTGKRLGELHAQFADVQFSPSGKLLATCDASGPIRVWEIATGRLVYTVKDSTGCLQIIAAADGVHLMGRMWQGVSAWNVHTGERVLGQGR